MMGDTTRTQPMLLPKIYSHYRAIESTKLSDITETFVPLHSKNTFQDWVKRLDIYDLDKSSADFFVDEAIVTKFTDYRNRVAA